MQLYEIIHIDPHSISLNGNISKTTVQYHSQNADTVKIQNIPTTTRFHHPAQRLDPLDSEHVD